MENERNASATLFDFKQISREVFEERINSSEVKWEDIKSENGSLDMDAAWQKFLEDVRASKGSYLQDLKSKEAQKFDQEFNEFFFEGGQEAYELSIEEGQELRYRATTIDYFVDMYEGRLSALTEAQEITPDPKLVELVKTKDYKALSEHLKEGIQDYLKGDVFKNYLNFISKFHKYSQKNIRLILAQNPQAENVASFNKWKELESPVKKGSKALYIYAPNPYIKKDKDNKPMLDENGEVIKEMTFKLVPVFDVSQTQNPELLPQPIYNLEEKIGSSERFVKVFQAIEQISPVPIALKETGGGINGYYSPGDKQIVVNKNMGKEMTLKTLIHEVTHAMLHTNSSAVFGDKTYRKQEFEAESVAYIVSNHLKVDASSYSFAYLSSWTNQGKDLKELEGSLDAITKQAQTMIEGIEKTLNKSYGLEQPQNKFEERLAVANEKKMIDKPERSEAISNDEPKKSHPQRNR